MIREMKIDDAEQIASLSFQLGYESTIAIVTERLNRVLGHNDHCVFVVEDGNRIVGWIHGFRALRVESDPFVEIGGLVVDEQYRRKGVGRELVGKVRKWAIHGDIKKLRVRCNVNRKETHEFYKKLGFVETKEQKVFDLVG